MKNEHNLEQLKYIWDNRNLENKVYQYLFHICIEPMKKGDWNRYTIWLNFHGNLINVSDVVYRVVESQKLKDDIKIWYDKQYYCRPTKVETTGFISIFLHLFYEGIARILLEQGMITETEAAEKSYNSELQIVFNVCFNGGEIMEPRTVKVIYDDGDYFFTLINADEQTIRNYYAIGSSIGFDNTRKIVAVEIL
ncbi:hypothetical protein NJNGDCLN_02135 [Mannheimia haemolytica]